MPKIFVKKKGKESEYVNIEKKESILFQVHESTPVDDLVMMPEQRKDIQEFAQNIAFERIQSKDNYFIIQSKPYLKKFNLVADKAQW